MTYTLEPLGYIKTCFPEKFGIPRQPLLAPSATAELLLLPPFNDPDCVEGLTESSHVWLSFVFHQHLNDKWKAKVRPPRLGGNKKCGVFATRSSFRPNSLGLSAVKLDDIIVNKNEIKLIFSGVDLLDGTPIVDIKPYISYSDSISNATNTLASFSPDICSVMFGLAARQFCQQQSQGNELSQLITEVLQQDPRPAYQNIDPNRYYKMKLMGFDIEWRCVLKLEKKMIEVVKIENTNKKGAV
ncbi:MAG: tRNA (N6-threonylcarbamoyladenosine(37)-N6)-methyltransferase TrmO [Cellvibrionaceae bacterium]